MRGEHVLVGLFNSRNTQYILTSDRNFLISKEELPICFGTSDEFTIEFDIYIYLL